MLRNRDEFARARQTQWKLCWEC